MSVVRLDYVRRTGKIAPKRPRAPERKCRRAACCKRFRGPQKQRYCTPFCRDTHQVELKIAHRGRLKGMPAANYGPPVIPGLPPPRCCGQKLLFGSDPMTGASIEYCAVCGERPLTNYGARLYSQRTELEAELDRLVTGARKPAQKRQYAVGHGDGLRQQLYKGGHAGFVAEYLVKVGKSNTAA